MRERGIFAEYSFSIRRVSCMKLSFSSLNGSSRSRSLTRRPSHRPARNSEPQRIPEEEKQQARRSCEKNLPARDALGAHAARTPAAQSQKSRSEEFGQVRVSEKPRRTLDVPQQTVRCAERAAVRIEPSVVFIRTNRFIQFLKPTTSVLFRTLC